jgi:hypothetical protein
MPGGIDAGRLEASSCIVKIDKAAIANERP